MKSEEDVRWTKIEIDETESCSKVFKVSDSHNGNALLILSAHTNTSACI